MRTFTLPNMCKVCPLGMRCRDFGNPCRLKRERISSLKAGDMSEVSEQGQKIDLRTGRSMFRFYVWGFGSEDKTRRRRIMWGESAERVRAACRRRGFTIYRIAPAPAMPHRLMHSREDPHAGSGRALGQETVMSVRGTNALSDVPGD